MQISNTDDSLARRFVSVISNTTGVIKSLFKLSLYNADVDKSTVVTLNFHH